jgi:hypothetical protein
MHTWRRLIFRPANVAKNARIRFPKTLERNIKNVVFFATTVLKQIDKVISMAMDIANKKKIVI